MHILTLVHALRFKLDHEVKAVRFNTGVVRYVRDPATSCSASSLIPVRALRFKFDPWYAHFLILVHALRSKLAPDVKAVRCNAVLVRYVLILLQAVRLEIDPGTRFALQA